MKIELELPDWAEERVIHILAGIEHVAYKFPWTSLMIKVERCNMCGKCCMGLDSERSKHFFPLVDGRCVYLEKEPGDNNRWRCGLGSARPYACCVNSGIKRIPECTEKYEPVS